jgi:hypothetical protein
MKNGWKKNVTKGSSERRIVDEKENFKKYLFLYSEI